MIFDRLENAQCYAGLSPRFQQAFAYLQTHDLKAMPAGRYAIAGEDVYVMVQDMPLKAWEAGKWEAHRDFADIQVFLDTDELLGVRFAQGLAVSEAYDAARDILFYDAAAPGLALPVRAGEFVILFPQDLHRPCTRRADAAPGQVSRRAVFKVRL